MNHVGTMQRNYRAISSKLTLARDRHCTISVILNPRRCAVCLANSDTAFRLGILYSFYLWEKSLHDTQCAWHFLFSFQIRLPKLFLALAAMLPTLRWVKILALGGGDWRGGGTPRPRPSFFSMASA